MSQLVAVLEDVQAGERLDDHLLAIRRELLVGGGSDRNRALGDGGLSRAVAVVRANPPRSLERARSPG